jgi:hypothetical protein
LALRLALLDRLTAPVALSVAVELAVVRLFLLRTCDRAACPSLPPRFCRIGPHGPEALGALLAGVGKCGGIFRILQK